MSLDSATYVLIADSTDYGIEINDLCLLIGLEPRLCTRGHAVLDVARYDSIQAAIVSIRLADHRGDALFYRLTAIQPTLRYRTILLTASQADIQIAKLTGCVWVPKSRDPSLVVEMVVKHLSTIT